MLIVKNFVNNFRGLFFGLNGLRCIDCYLKATGEAYGSIPEEKSQHLLVPTQAFFFLIIIILLD